MWRTLRSSEAETELRAVVATDANRDTRDDAEPVRPESVPRGLCATCLAAAEGAVDDNAAAFPKPLAPSSRTKQLGGPLPVTCRSLAPSPGNFFALACVSCVVTDTLRSVSLCLLNPVC